MKKRVVFKQAVIAASIALTVAIGVSANVKAAWAGYLSAPSLSTSASVGAFPFTINTPVNTAYATSTSSYGNTIPTASSITSTTGISPVSSISDFATLTLGGGGSISSTGANILYDSTTGRSNGGNLNLSLIASMTNPYSGSTVNGTLSGNVLSQVFRITSGSNAGDLVFTYQFNVSSSATLSASSATIGNFNMPTTTFALGEGINATGITTTNNATAGTGVSQSGTLALLGTGLSGGVASLNVPLTANVFFQSNGYAQSFDYELSSGLVAPGDVSAQIFVATTATNITLGSISVAYQGTSGSADVYVPGTPEPATLVLFATGLGILTFVTFRKRLNKPFFRTL